MSTAQSNKREWVLLPEPGFDYVDDELLAHRLLEIEGFADRLGYAVTVSPLRVRKSDGTFFTGGYVFRAHTVPAVSEDEYARFFGLTTTIPQLDPEDGEELIAAVDDTGGTDQA